jgi:hypothetical protein
MEISESHALLVQRLERVPEKLSQHRHKKAPALYFAVTNLLFHWPTVGSARPATS